VSNLVEHRDGTMTGVDDGPGTALAARPAASLMTPEPPLALPNPLATRSKGPSRLAVAVITAALVAAVALGAAAFSGGSSASGSDAGGGDGRAAGAAPRSLAASVANSASASSVSFQVSATETTPSSTTTLLQGHGSADLVKGVGRLTANVPGLTSLLGSGASGSVDVISDGTDVYLDLPGVTSLTGGKRWVETSLSGLKSLTGSSAGSLSLSTLADPTQVLGMLGTLGSTVTNVGTVTLDGQRVTEYQTSITAADIASKLSHGSAASSAAAKALQQLGTPDIPVTAWVSRDGHLRQLALTADVSHASLRGLVGSGSPVATPAGTKVNLTIGLSHYGDPVSVGIPPASEVTNLNSVLPSLNRIISQLGGALSGIASRV